MDVHPTKNVSIGIDPYPYFTMPSPPIMTLRPSHVGTSSRPWASRRMHVLNCLSGLIRRPQPAPHEQSAQTLKVGEPYCYHLNDFLFLYIYVSHTYLYMEVDLNSFICKRPFFANKNILSRMFRNSMFFFRGVMVIHLCAAEMRSNRM